MADHGDPDELFQVVSKLGEGSYGSVFKAIDQRDGKFVALKVLSLPSEDRTALDKEIAILRNLHSAQIVAYKGTFFKDGQTWIVMEYCGAGSVQDLMASVQRCLTEAQIACVMKQALLGLKHMHENNKVHRDIKSGNILLQETGDAKLADFGISAELTEAENKRRTVIGTPYWMAPEVVKWQPYDCKADIWSLGITAYEIAVGCPPHAEVPPMRALFVIANSPPPILPTHTQWSPEFQYFLSLCLTINPHDRPSADDLLNTCPFIVNAPGKQVLAELVAYCLPAIEALRANPPPVFVPPPAAAPADTKEETPDLERQKSVGPYATSIKTSGLDALEPAYRNSSSLLGEGPLLPGYNANSSMSAPPSYDEVVQEGYIDEGKRDAAQFRLQRRDSQHHFVNYDQALAPKVSQIARQESQMRTNQAPRGLDVAGLPKYRHPSKCFFGMEVSISCRQLPFLLTKPSTAVAVCLGGAEICRTEFVEKNADPEYNTLAVTLPVEDVKLAFLILIADGNKKKKMAVAIVMLGDLLKSNEWTGPLQDPATGFRKPQGRMTIKWRFQKQEYKEMTASLGAPVPKKLSKVSRVDLGRMLRLSFSCQNISKSAKASLIVTKSAKKGEPETELGQTEALSKDPNPVFLTTMNVLNEADTILHFYLMDGSKNCAIISYELSNIVCTPNLWKYSFSDPKTGHRLPTAALTMKWEEVANPEEKELTKDELANMINTFRSCCEIKDHSFHLRTYPHSFVGKDTVTALVKAGVCHSRDDAVRYGNKLITRANVFVHVTKDGLLFRDDNELYRFINEETR